MGVRSEPHTYTILMCVRVCSFQSQFQNAREEKRRSSAISAVETPAATFSGSRLTNIDLGHTTNLLLGASDFSSSFKKINSFSDMVCKPAKRTASWRALLLEEPVLFGVEDECFFSGDFFDEHTIKI